MTGGQESVCVEDIVLEILSLPFFLRLFSVSLFLSFDDSFGAFSSAAVFVCMRCKARRRRELREKFLGEARKRCSPTGKQFHRQYRGLLVENAIMISHKVSNSHSPLMNRLRASDPMVQSSLGLIISLLSLSLAFSWSLYLSPSFSLFVPPSAHLPLCISLLSVDSLSGYGNRHWRLPPAVCQSPEEEIDP